MKTDFRIQGSILVALVGFTLSASAFANHTWKLAISADPGIDVLQAVHYLELVHDASPSWPFAQVKAELLEDRAFGGPDFEKKVDDEAIHTLSTAKCFRLAKAKIQEGVESSIFVVAQGNTEKEEFKKAGLTLVHITHDPSSQNGSRYDRVVRPQEGKMGLFVALLESFPRGDDLEASRVKGELKLQTQAKQDLLEGVDGSKNFRGYMDGGSTFRLYQHYRRMAMIQRLHPEYDEPLPEAPRNGSDIFF